MTQPYPNPNQIPTYPQIPVQQPLAPLPLSVTAVLAVIFGSLALLMSWIPIINNLSIILGIVGIILSIPALMGVMRNKKRSKPLAIVGAALCVVALIISIAIQAVTAKALNEVLEALDDVTISSSASAEDSPAAEVESDVQQDQPTDSAQDTVDVQDMEGTVGDAYVKIVSFTKSGTDYEGNPVGLLTVEFTNNSAENKAFITLVTATVFQNKKALDEALVLDAPAGVDPDSLLDQLQPGGTTTVSQFYVLEDDSDVTVELEPLFSLGDGKVTHTFPLQ